MTGAFSKICRAQPFGSIAAQTRRLEQGFAAFEDWRDKVLEEEEIERHKLDRKIVREDQWMHGGVTGRRKRNVRRVRELRAMRQRSPRAAPCRRQRPSRRGGRRALRQARCRNDRMSKGYGGDRYRHRISILRVMRGDRLGIVGPNGAGKTTLLKLLTGEIAPDSGTIRHGANLEIVVARPEARRTQSQLDGCGRADGRTRRSGRHQRQGAPRRELHEGFSVSCPSSGYRRSACSRAASGRG